MLNSVWSAGKTMWAQLNKKYEGKDINGANSFEMNSELLLTATASPSVPIKGFLTARKGILPDKSSINYRKQPERRVTVRKRQCPDINETVEAKRAKLSLTPVNKKCVAKNTQNPPKIKRKRGPNKKKIEKIFMKELKCYNYVGMLPHVYANVEAVIQLPDFANKDECRSVFQVRKVQQVSVPNKKTSLFMTLWDTCAVEAEFESWRMVKKAHFNLCKRFVTNYRDEIIDSNLQDSFKDHILTLLSKKHLSSGEVLELMTNCVP